MPIKDDNATLLDEIIKNCNSETISKWISFAEPKGHELIRDETLERINRALEPGKPKTERANAFYLWAVMFENGIIEKQNLENAIIRYTDAANLGNIDAMYLLAGKYVDTDEEIEWYQKAANLGHIDAKRALARSNDVGAILDLGRMYSKNEDYEKAKEYFQKAVELNNPEAMVALAGIYEVHESTKNHEIVIKLYEHARSLGSSDAMTLLGDKYQSGLGTTRDFKKARELYEEAIALKNPRAMINLAKMYGHDAVGQDGGAEKNYEEAIKLYGRASTLGDTSANIDFARTMMSLATLYVEQLSKIRKEAEGTDKTADKKHGVIDTYHKSNDNLHNNLQVLAKIQTLYKKVIELANPEKDKMLQELIDNAGKQIIYINKALESSTYTPAYKGATISSILSGSAQKRPQSAPTTKGRLKTLKIEEGYPIQLQSSTLTHNPMIATKTFSSDLTPQQVIFFAEAKLNIAEVYKKQLSGVELIEEASKQKLMENIINIYYSVKNLTNPDNIKKLQGLIVKAEKDFNALLKNPDFKIIATSLKPIPSAVEGAQPANVGIQPGI